MSEIDTNGTTEKTWSTVKATLVLQVVYVVFISLFAIFRGVFPSLEFLLILVLLALVWRAEDRAFLKAFAPLILLLITFQALRNVADTLAVSEINVENLIQWEKALFGGVIPASYLQIQLSGRPWSPALDLVGNVFYLSHFVTPVVAALLIWKQRRAIYGAYVFGLLAVSYIGFVIYVIFPAAPPWWASHFGYLPDWPVSLASSALTPEILLNGPNPVAAMPSLHVAYPTFIALFLTFAFGRKALAVWILPLGVGFAALYLGHHYVIDLIAGAALSVAVFAAVSLMLKFGSSRSLNLSASAASPVRQQDTIETAPTHSDIRDDN